MLRTIVLAGVAAPLAAMAVPLAIPMAAIGLAMPAHAQIGTIFSDAPRPPGSIPRVHQLPPPDDDEEDVPNLPPGRLLPPPNRPLQGQSAMPGAVQSQPLAPPPGVSVAPRNAPPGIAVAPPQPRQGNQPGGANQGQRESKGVPQPPASLQPGDEIVTEPPPEKIINKEASFTGLDKITGRTINFDEKIGETVQFGALRVKTDACYTRPATEAANTDAFVEVDEITLQGEVKRIFSGWMFAASPGLHAVEHPIYDIWLTNCKEPETTVVSAAPEPAKPAPPPPPAAAMRRPAPRPAAPRRPPPPPQQQTQQQLPPPPPPPQQEQPRGLFGIFRQN